MTARRPWRIRQWPLGTKLAAAFAVPLALAIAQALIAYRILAADVAATTWVEHTYQVIGIANEAQDKLVDARYAFRDFLLTGNELYVSRYEADQQAYTESLRRLEDLTADNSPQVQRWQTIERLAAAWVNQTAQPAIERARAGGNSSSIGAQIALSTLDDSEIQFDATDRLFSEAVGVENQLLNQRLAAAKGGDELLQRILIGGVIVIGLLGLGLAALLSTSIGRGFGRLLRAAGRLADGELDERIAVDRDDEIGLAAKGFNAMADRLQSVVADLRSQVAQREQAEAALQESHAKLTEWVGELERRDRESSILAETAELLQACVSVQEAYDVLNGVLPRLFPEHPAAVCAINDSRNLVEVVAESDSNTATQRVFSPDECWALRLGRPHRAVRAAGTVTCPHVTEPAPFMSMCVPMTAQGQSVGLLHLTFTADANSSDRSFRAIERLTATLADEIGLALVNLKLRETLRTQALRDSLTGLFNRRYLEESLDRELSRAQRNQAPLSVIMLDIDHFKQFNDTYGHQVGDEVLRQVARLLAAEIRNSDLACRYGGEEFTLILPDARAEDALRRAEHIRKTVEQLSITSEGKTHGQVTLSFGVAAYPAHGGSIDELIHAADAALYRAKANGRNCVELAVPVHGYEPQAGSPEATRETLSAPPA